MIESIGSRVLTPTLQKTKDGAPFSQIGTGRSKAGPPATGPTQASAGLANGAGGFLGSLFGAGCR